MRKRKKHVLFSTDGKGNWWRREFAEQCGEKVGILSLPCQGAAGHAGLHWAYALNGSLEQNMPDGGCQRIPPGHTEYISPVDKVQDWHTSNYTDSEVTDPQELRRLEAGELRDGESCSRPIKE